MAKEDDDVDDDDDPNGKEDDDYDGLLMRLINGFRMLDSLEFLVCL